MEENVGKDNFRKYIDEFFDRLELYDDINNGHHYKDLIKAGIDVFLDKENGYNALEIYRTFFMIYQITPQYKSDDSEENDAKIVAEPNTLLNLVNIMKKYEESTGELVEKQRDHLIHSVNVFLLGLAIFSQNVNYRRMYREYILSTDYKNYYKIDGRISFEEFFYRWGIAALFHDIGYPVEIIGKQMKKFLQDGVKSISHSYEADIAIDFKDFNEFNSIIKIKPDFADGFRNDHSESKFLDLFKPTDIMAYNISEEFNIEIKPLLKHLNSFVNIMGESGFIDHGFFSSILVLNSYGYLIQKYTEIYDIFYYPIADSATAILLHNYYRNVLQKKPFELKQLHPRKNPLAYLLILCDELQEWNRKSYGAKDKGRNQINELAIEVTDERLELEYVLKGGSMGFGFSQDKEDMLHGILNIASVFKKSFSIVTRIEHENDMVRESVISEIQVPDVLMRNVEKLAILIHEQYNETIKRQYEEKIENGEAVDGELKSKYDNMCSYGDLSPQLKIANIRQARSIPYKLSLIGCEMANLNDEREEVLQFNEQEVLELAKMEHEEWRADKEESGWTYGPVRDDANFIHDCLLPWDELSSEIQQLDIDPILEIPHYVHELGLKIVETKTRLLSVKMHEFFMENHDFDMEGIDEKIVGFDELPDYIKYTNYKLTDFIVKKLDELGYSVVEKNAPDEAIASLDGDELDYLAMTQHEEWCAFRRNFGWKYGEIWDDQLKTNPLLVDWEDLDDQARYDNLETLESLPLLCSQVGLKIIKNI